MADPAPIPPSTDHLDNERALALAANAMERAALMIGLPLSVGLDGQNVAEGSAFEATQALERFLKVIQLQREMEVQARPWSVSQVVRG